MTFNSRQHAGQLLAAELEARNIKPDLVYGLARGGVVAAAEIAAAFKIPLKPLIVRKISPPGSPEFALGAIAGIPGSDPSAVRSAAKDGSEPSKISVWWDEDTIRRLGLTPDWQKQQVRDKKIEISNYLSQISFTEKVARSGSKLSNIVLVDDGAATGATMMAAIGAIRKGFKTGVSRRSQETSDKNRKIIVVLPIASTDAAEKIRQQADETVILFIDPYFRAVGQYYKQFEQVSWREVKTLLQLNYEAYRKARSQKTPQRHDRSRAGDERGGLGVDL